GLDRGREAPVPQPVPPWPWTSPRLADDRHTRLKPPRPAGGPPGRTKTSENAVPWFAAGLAPVPAPLFLCGRPRLAHQGWLGQTRALDRGRRSSRGANLLLAPSGLPGAGLPGPGAGSAIPRPPAANAAPRPALRGSAPASHVGQAIRESGPRVRPRRTSARLLALWRSAGSRRVSPRDAPPVPDRPGQAASPSGPCGAYPARLRRGGPVREISS